jgi:hypothetical protein
VAFTGVHGYKALGAMGKPLELDGGKHVARKQKGRGPCKSDESDFRTFPCASVRRIIQRYFFGVEEFGCSIMNGGIHEHERPSHP